MTGVHLMWLAKVYLPLAVPISATPAADPTDNILPTMPHVSVTSSHWKCGISGCILRIENMTGILSTIAEVAPRNTLVVVGPHWPYIFVEAISRYPIKANPPTLNMTPKKNSSVSHSTIFIALKISYSISFSLNTRYLYFGTQIIWYWHYAIKHVIICQIYSWFFPLVCYGDNRLS